MGVYSCFLDAEAIRLYVDTVDILDQCSIQCDSSFLFCNVFPCLFFFFFFLLNIEPQRNKRLFKVQYS